jgi:hypothetical protein
LRRLMLKSPNLCQDRLGTSIGKVVERRDMLVSAGKPYATCNLQRWHDVHFTSAGKQFCAIQVAHAVAPLLAPKWNTLCTATGNNVQCKA